MSGTAAANRINARKPRKLRALNGEFIDELCEAIRAGVRPEVAAPLNGVPSRTFEEWMPKARQPGARPLLVELAAARLVAHGDVHGALPERPVVAFAPAGADGVGLLRTELLFLGAGHQPDEDEQERAYRAIAEGLGGRPLVLRALDAGADKPLAYLPLEPEKNPFLGVRGLRLGLSRPDLLETQVRAALRAAAGHQLRLMFPMVTNVDEFLRAREIVAAAAAALDGESGVAAGHRGDQSHEEGH